MSSKVDLWDRCAVTGRIEFSSKYKLPGRWSSLNALNGSLQGSGPTEGRREIYFISIHDWKKNWFKFRIIHYRDHQTVKITFWPHFIYNLLPRDHNWRYFEIGKYLSLSQNLVNSRHTISEHTCWVKIYTSYNPEIWVLFHPVADQATVLAPAPGLISKQYRITEICILVVGFTQSTWSSWLLCWIFHEAFQ